MNETKPAAKTSGNEIPETCIVRTPLALSAHHAAAAHHRLHALSDEAGDLACVLSDRRDDARIARRLRHGDALPRERELAPVAARVAKERRKACAHAGHLQPVLEVVVHARDVGLKL